MRILVIDDTKVHLDAALQTLVGHDVTLCSSHDEADELLREQSPYWEVILTDLLMPAGKMDQGDEGLQHVGKEMPVGWSLALRAAREGAKFIAVVTDMNHHLHPASAMLDWLDEHIFNIDGAKMLLTNRPGSVGIKGTECTCKECGGSGVGSSNDGVKTWTYKCYGCERGIAFAQRGKNWGRVLSRLLGKGQVE